MQRSRLQRILDIQNLDAVLISKVSDIIYLTDFTYFSEKEREAFLLITRNNRYIFTDARYSTAVKEKVKTFNLVEISPTYPFAKALSEIVKKQTIESLGLQQEDLKVSEYKKISQFIKRKKPFSLSYMRMKKNSFEKEMIRKACEISDKAFTHVLHNIANGMTEMEVLYIIESFIRQQHFELSFTPIVAFGKNAAIPHHKSNETKVKKADVVLLDFGAKCNGYSSDMTRTLVFGRASNDIRKMYDVVLSSQLKAVEYIEKKEMGGKIKASALDSVAREYIVSQGYPSIPHALGHGIGIDVHEKPFLSPTSKEVITKNMVFSIEPGIYIPGVAGIRIEDLFSLDQGLTPITLSDKRLIEL